MLESYESSVRDARQRGQDDPIGFARHRNARIMYTTALAHVRYFMMTKFFEEITSVETGSERRALHQLCTFFALSDIVGTSASVPWSGVLSASQCDAFENVSDTLMDRLRPNAVPFVQAFDISDTVLNSALGGSDGRVYEKLYEHARTSAMNVDKDGNRIDVPPCLRAVEKYLSRDFLANASGLARSKI